MELMHRYSDLKQAEIGKKFGGLDYGAVSRESKRQREKLIVDRKPKLMIEKLKVENNKGKNLTLI